MSRPLRFHFKIPAALFTCVLLSQFAGCKEDSSFKGSAGKGSTEKNSAQSPKKKGNKTDGGSSDGTPTTPSEGKRCVSKAVDLRVMFLLDSTGSMQPQIDLVKVNMASFASRLESITFDNKKVKVSKVKVGAVVYRDSDDELWQIELGDPASLASRLGDVQADGGDDTPEGGLSALDAGLSLLASEAPSKDADLVPVVIAVTDTWSHDGKGSFGSRDCSGQNSDFQKNLTNKIYDKLLIYDASPNIPAPAEAVRRWGAELNCSPYDYGKSPISQQWDNIRETWAQGNADRGKVSSGVNLGFPFSSNALLETLPSGIAASFTACE